MTQTPFSSENDLSAAVKKWLNSLNELGAINTIHFHVPNEFKPYKSAVKAWQKKESIGCVAGAPDWVIAWQGGTLFLELKLANSQKQAISKMCNNQSKFALKCESKGVFYRLAWDKESFIAALKDVGLLD